MGKSPLNCWLLQKVKKKGKKQKTNNMIMKLPDQF